MLQAIEKVLAAIERKPEIVRLISRLVPQTVVSGGGGDAGLSGAAAIFGSMFKSRDETEQPSGATPAQAPAARTPAAAPAR